MRNKKPSSATEDTLRRADSIMDSFKHFTDGYRVLFLIHRSKEGAESANNDKLRKIVSKNEQEFKTALIELLTEAEASEYPLRIYSAVNPRNINKAIRHFKQEQLDADYYDEESRNSFYTDVKNRFIGALMKPASRAESLFLLDCDTTKQSDDALYELGCLKVPIVKMYATKNGWHIVTAPFNPNEFKVEGVEIKKDGLLLLKY